MNHQRFSIPKNLYEPTNQKKAPFNKIRLNTDELKPVYVNHKPFEIPEDAFFSLNKFSFNQMNNYEEALLKYGLLLIRTTFKDEGHVFFSSLIKHLGIPLKHVSSDKDFIWHIKAVKDSSNVTKKKARSHTQKLFQMHTDASYDIIPPRYALFFY